VQTFSIETVISKNRVLTIRDVPFKVGDKVQVIILNPPVRQARDKRYPLRGKKIRYVAPFDSVAENEWQALR
jgi:hypothetical protein